MLQEKKIYVYFDNNLDKRIKVGCLFADFQRGKEKFSFEYDDEFFTSFLFRNFFDYDLQPYNIAVSNTDDHLRNHGFILTEEGWRLSPLYDVNPNMDKDSLSLNITEDDNALSVDLAIETSEHYGIDKKVATDMANEILLAVRDNWRNVAEKNGLSKSAIEYMSPAFSVTEI